jgi:hypothetical protein
MSMFLYAPIGTFSQCYLDAGKGTYDLTGTSNNFLRQRILVASGASYTLAGISANFTINMPSASGTYTLTGTSNNFLRQRILVASTGTYDLTGISNNFIRQRILVASTGTYNLTGVSANLLRVRNIIASAGTYTLTGIAATIDHPHVERTNITSIFSEIAPAGSSMTLSTSSFTPANNSLLVVAVGIINLGTSGTKGVSGGGLTWTKRIGSSPQYYGGSPPDYYGTVEIWTAPVTTGASMTVTATTTEVSGSDPGKISIHVVNYKNYNTTTPVGTTASNTTAGDAALELTLSSAPESSSEIFATRFRADNGSEQSQATPGGGWTEIFDTVILKLWLAEQIHQRQ